jgi:hypothetical protein
VNRSVLVLNLNQTKGRAGDELTVKRYVYGVCTGLLELETLEVHNQVTSEEGNTLRKVYLQVANDGHALRVKSYTVLINDGDTQLVVTLVLRQHAKTQSQSASGVYNRELTGKESIKSALNAELTLIIGGIVAKYGNLNIHNLYL